MTNHLSAAYTRNADGLRQMADKAARTGKRVGGCTEARLRADEARYRELAAMDQAAMDAHQAGARLAVQARLAALRATA
jgi:hypothetical protein